MVLLSGHASTKPSYHLTPEARKQGGETHVSFVCPSVGPQRRLLFTGPALFLFIPQAELVAFL